MWLYFVNWFSLEWKVGLELDLSPNEVGLLIFFSYLVPRSALYQASYKVRIVSFAQENFNFSLIVGWRLNNHFIWKSHFPEKITIVVKIKRRNEFLYLDSSLDTYGRPHWLILFPLSLRRRFAGLSQTQIEDRLSFSGPLIYSVWCLWK